MGSGIPKVISFAAPPTYVRHNELHQRKIEQARLDDDLRASTGEPFLAHLL